MGQRNDIVNKAISQIGYIEKSNNNNKYGAYFGANYQPWCGYFVSWCAVQCKIPTSIFYQSGYVPSIVTTAKQRGVWKTRTYSPKPGDLAIFDFNLNNTGDHIEIVRNLNGSTLYTIGGNTSAQYENANGDGVFLKGRSKSYNKILGYVAIPYEGDNEMTTVQRPIVHPELGKFTATLEYEDNEHSGTLRSIIDQFTNYKVTGWVDATKTITLGFKDGYKPPTNQTEIDSLKAQIATLEKAKADLATENTNLQTEIDDLEIENDALASQISESSSLLIAFEKVRDFFKGV